MEKDLIKKAIEAMSGSYSPYSNLKVGACLLTKSGKYFKGANVENVSYSLSSCAERNAIYPAVNSGEKDFVALAVISSDPNTFCIPCGACLQVMSEFSKDMKIIACKSQNEYKIYTIKELLPNLFCL